MAGEGARQGLELRLGLAAHDPASREKGTVDATGVIITPRFAPSPLLPMLAAGGSINLSGRTSHLHGGALWRWEFSEKLFGEIGAGGAFHTGKSTQSAHRNAMGCAFAFRESFGLGYRMSSQWSLVASAEHLSNAGLCRRNRGMTNLGLSAGYSF